MRKIGVHCIVLFAILMLANAVPAQQSSDDMQQNLFGG